MITNVAVAGARGRLGSLICEVIESHKDFTLVARLDRASPLSEWEAADVLIDATNFESSQKLVPQALKRKQKVIIATSGWSAENIANLEVDDSHAVLLVPNFSLGSVLGTLLAEKAAPYFESVEIIETHHAKKIDSPSGTAVRTAELIAAARNNKTGEKEASAPFTDQEARGQLVSGVPVHSLRMAGVLAKQEVRFGGAGETLSITHDTTSNDSYRAGIRAALEAIHNQKGVSIGLASILGLNS